MLTGPMLMNACVFMYTYIHKHVYPNKRSAWVNMHGKIRYNFRHLVPSTGIESYFSLYSNVKIRFKANCVIKLPVIAYNLLRPNIAPSLRYCRISASFFLIVSVNISICSLQATNAFSIGITNKVRNWKKLKIRHNCYSNSTIIYLPLPMFVFLNSIHKGMDSLLHDILLSTAAYRCPQQNPTMPFPNHNHRQRFFVYSPRQNHNDDLSSKIAKTRINV